MFLERSSCGYCCFGRITEFVAQVESDPSQRMFHGIKLHRNGNEERCIDNAGELMNFAKNLKPRYWKYNSKNQTTSTWDELASKMTDIFAQWETPYSKRVKLENQTITDEVRIIVYTLHKLILSCNQLCIFVALASILQEHVRKNPYAIEKRRHNRSMPNQSKSQSALAAMRTFGL